MKKQFAYAFFMVALGSGIWIGHSRAQARELAAPPAVAEVDAECWDGSKPTLKPTSPPADPPPKPDTAYCAWYQDLAGRADCDAGSPIPGQPGPNDKYRKILLGYNTTCQNMTNLQNSCVDASTGAKPVDYDKYTNGMRTCLQNSAAGSLVDPNNPGCLKQPMTCQNMQQTVADSHTQCNLDNNFCGLSCGTLTCFGQAIGDAWGPFFTGLAKGGPTTPIGTLATIKAGMCGGDPAAAMKMTDCMCNGYQQACRKRYRGKDGEGMVGDILTGNEINYANCVASCPRIHIPERNVVR
jgi:hypothetical protein